MVMDFERSHLGIFHDENARIHRAKSINGSGKEKLKTITSCFLTLQLQHSGKSVTCVQQLVENLLSLGPKAVD